MIGVAVLGVLVVAALVLVIPYELRAHPGPVPVNSVVKGFEGRNSTEGGGKHAYTLPAQGVYSVKGSGTEQINVPPNSQRDGSTMPASVTYVNHGCWRWRVDYNVAHWEAYNFCPNRTNLLEGAEVNWQSWDFGTVKVTNLEQVFCQKAAVVLPLKPRSGQTFRWSCTGTNTSVSGKTSQRVVVHIVGMTDVKVGDVSVPVVHEVQDTSLSGTQHGSVTENWWFSRESGLPVRLTRKVVVYSSSPIGTVTYHESGVWQMTSLEPEHAPAKGGGTSGR
jgi:hypothetical protein